MADQRQRNRELEQRRERERIEKGICIRCTRKAVPGKTRCTVHARRLASKMEQHRMACKAADICPACRQLLPSAPFDDRLVAILTEILAMPAPRRLRYVANIAAFLGQGQDHDCPPT
jgi:hypothetical protein